MFRQLQSCSEVSRDVDVMLFFIYISASVDSFGHPTLIGRTPMTHARPTFCFGEHVALLRKAAGKCSGIMSR